MILRVIWGLNLLVIPTWSIFSFQDSASPSIDQLIKFHDFIIVVIIIITILVGANIIFIVLSKFNNRALLQEQSIEIMWTIVPIFILLGITLPSLQSLYILDDPFKANLTIKVIGHQWYWSYEYSDFSDIEFDCYINVDLRNILPRLLDTDNSVVLPILRKIRVIVTAADVIHSWALPVLGIKVDAVPGRLNQLMFIIRRTGLFFGQCSEICGANHRFIPIKLERVPMNYFIDWINLQRN